MGKNNNNAKRKYFNPTNSGFIDNIIVNDETYCDYLNRIKELAISMFEWVNLPSSMDAFFLEQCLYYYGAAAAFYEKDFNGLELGFINTKCSTAGELNLYGKPTSISCYTFNFQKYKQVYYGFKNKENEDTEQCIICYNNISRLPTCISIENFAYRLYNAERTCDINLNAQKTPIIILVNDKQRLTLENLYSQYEGNRPVIFADKNLMENNKLTSIKTEAPYVVDKVSDYKKEIWNELLTYLGINNLQNLKKERMITNEANQNNELINYYLQNKLATRKEFCKQFNEYFNLPEEKQIDVKIRSDLYNIIKQTESIIMNSNTENELLDIIEKGVNNGQIHYTIKNN